MLPKIETSTKKLEDYQHIINKKQFEEIKVLANDLKGLKVAMVNATPRGGGVAEILRSLVPLMKGVGLKAEWYTIPPQDDFFKVTKEMHNALQGKNYDFPFSHRKKYLRHMERTAKLMQDMKPDVWVINDPQPAGVIQLLGNFHPSICHIHIDLSAPNEEVWDFISGYLEMYDAIVVSSKDFVKPEIKDKAVVFPPAIDPLLSKNVPLDLNSAKRILQEFGLNPNRPLISQVARFDPWKDPLNVLQSYKIAKKKIPGLQLALLGFFEAQDDPEGAKVLKVVQQAVGKDPDVFLCADLNLLGKIKIDDFVNAVQVVSKVILQKSIREGFGMSVTEAMWKKKPVIGGKASGIMMQIRNRENGFIASSPAKTAERIVELIENPGLSAKIGQEAHLTVKSNFLMPRLLRDYLKLLKKTANGNRKDINFQARKNLMNTLACY
ncbi:MAG: glycosyltransferase [Candidatus Nealsonbacteria bacterium]|nr:glycosyltransferase [Candidatus Nealsonbacteria bacterium]